MSKTDPAEGALAVDRAGWHETLLHRNMHVLVLLGCKASDLSLLHVEEVDGMEASQRFTSVHLLARFHSVVALLVGPGRDVRWNVQGDILGYR